MHRPVPAFEERQRFRQWWVIALMLVCVAPIPVTFGYGWYQQAIVGIPFGDRPMSSDHLAWTALSSGLLCFGLLWLMWAAELCVRVDSTGVTARFFPFHFRPVVIDMRRVVDVRAVTYRPIREYGGWGLRYGGGGGKAYNVSGDRGVRLDYSDGKHLLLGSQDPNPLVAAIRKYQAAQEKRG